MPDANPPEPSQPESRQYGIVPIEIFKSLTGLEFLQGLASGKFPAPPISRMMGFTLTEIGRGHAVFTCTPSFEHYNPISTVHGGLAGTLLDSTMSCAVQTLLE